jgi:carbamoyl-phosphate synthase large subunit
MDPYVIGITGTGSLIGQAVIKSIKRSPFAKQVRIIGFDYFENTVGSYWCDQNFVLPDLLKAEAMGEWKSRLIHHIRKESIRILFIGVDFELPVFASLKEEIKAETGCIVLVSSEAVIAIANDKYLTYRFLKENGLYHPLTWLPHEIAKEAIQYPCIVKPRVGARSRDVYVVRSADELDAILKKVPGPIIQELVGTMNEEYTCGVIFFDGKPRKIIALNRSLKEGNTFRSAFSHSFPPIIYDYLKSVAEKLQPFGPCNFQLRLDEKGIPKIFEINARHSGTTFIRSLFGFNEVAYIIEYLKGAAPSDFELREGTVIRYFDEFFIENK